MSSRVSLALSLLLYAVALLCKEPAIVLPALVAAYEWLYSDARKLARTLRAIVPYLAVTAAYVAVRVVALRGFAHPMSGISLAVELLTAPSLLVFYLRHLVWPAGIAEYYDQQYVTTLGAAFFIPLLIVVAVASALWWWSRRWRSPGIAFAALWVIIPIVPTLKISTFLFREIAHDRYLYVPVLGFAMLIAIAITKGSTEASANAPDAGDSAPRLLLGLPLVPAVIVVALTAGYAVATSAQETQWSNPLSLYARAAQISPNNLTAVSQFAQELTRRGRYDDALPVLVHLTRIAPADPTSWFLLGKNLYAMRRYAEAEPHFQRSLALFANAVATLYYSAENRIAMGRLDDAETQLRRALQLAPDGYGLHEALATIFVARGNAAAARSEFEAELRTHPENSSAKAKLADLR